MNELLRRPKTWFIAVPVAVVVLGLLGPYVWFNLVKEDPPPRLSFADVTTTTSDVSSSVATTSTSALVTATSGAVVTTRVTVAAKTQVPSAGPVDGAWHVGAGSLAGYRIGETVGVRPGEAVGRTDKVTGAMTINGTTVTSGSWTVDMVSVKSDDERRDQNYRDKMEVDKYPTSTFALGAPANFGSVPPDGTDVTVPIRGSLTLHGVTRSVDFNVKARRANGRIEVLGSIPVRFADYNIENPSNGYARTDDHGLVEFLLLFNRG